MFENVVWLYAIPLMWILLALITFLRFVKIPSHILQEKDVMKRRRTKRLMVFIFRGLALTLILIALAQPTIEQERTIPGDPTITLLVDHSASMDLYDNSFIEPLTEKLRETIPVELKELNTKEESPVGDFILNNLKPNSNLLIISDGRVTSGAKLDTLSQVAVSINSTISVIEPPLLQEDVAVSITGPAKTVADIENTYNIHISRATHEAYKPVELRVLIDGEEVFHETTKEEVIQVSKTFSKGVHNIIAEVSNPDFNTLNNRFILTTRVIKQPKVLLVTQVPTQLKELLDQLYDVDESGSIPADLSAYYAVIIYDMPAEALTNLEALQDFVVEGNGVFFIGGYHSFDRSSYKNSPLETMLPVTVGSYEKKRGDATIALAIDISGSSGVKYIYVPGSGKLERVESNALSIQKALAIDVLRNINEGNRVGAVAFTDSAYVVAPVEPLSKNKDELIDKISRLIGEGQTDFAVGLGGAYELVKGFNGEKNIIMITDGKTGSLAIKQNTLALARTLADLGVNIYVIGVGEGSDVEFLSEVAQLGNGLYFAADQTNKLNILFGEPEGEEVEQTIFDLFILNQFHFITQGLQLDATMTAFNQVNAKKSAQVLVTLSTGEPALTVWRYGLGRVGALTVFSGENNLGDLLRDPNSRLLTRAINWHIGDPERKEEYFIDIPDARINTPTLITVKTKDKIPQATGLSFEKIDETTYVAQYTPTVLGIDEVLGVQFAVNYPKEYEQVGLSPLLKEIARDTGGGIFAPDQVQEMLEVSTSAQNRITLSTTPLTWPFILGALILIFCEITIRRILDNWVKP
ncbi:VWA domain-containing protein [Candidatus Woesearchaeota archaeon]|nr:MAG: VWA domain-containing protein [Candidatus Woesearchaeota archaeon]